MVQDFPPHLSAPMTGRASELTIVKMQTTGHGRATQGIGGESRLEGRPVAQPMFIREGDRLGWTVDWPGGSRAAARVASRLMVQGDSQRRGIPGTPVRGNEAEVIFLFCTPIRMLTADFCTVRAHSPPLTQPSPLKGARAFFFWLWSIDRLH
jgi:hypothetical protein